MITFPNCKINLGLHIINKRDDGFHDLETVFYPIAFHDALESVKTASFSFIQTGISINGSADDNLCVKAFHHLKKNIPRLPSVHIHLHKAIPMGAGLGGGSADAAFTLKLLNEQFDLKLSREQLISYAVALGSDCPFFIINQPCFATGRGEVLHEINIDLSAYSFLLINPGIHINTAWAFSQLRIRDHHHSIKEVIKQPIHTWKELLTNDFEDIVFNTHPSLLQIKQDLYQHGAVYASMSGSGSTLYGIFEKNKIPKVFRGKFPLVKSIP